MRVLMDTPLERTLQRAFFRGVPMGGTGGGAVIHATSMIASYADRSYSPRNALHQDALAIWNESDRRGLSFGNKQVVLEHAIWERARLPRLLNAIAQVDTPPIGIGIERDTGMVLVDDTTLTTVFGLHSVLILDAQTFEAADSHHFGDISGTLAMRGVLFHLLAPSDYGYDITSRSTTLAPVLATGHISYEAVHLQAGAGVLILSGGVIGCV